MDFALSNSFAEIAFLNSFTAFLYNRFRRSLNVFLIFDWRSAFLADDVIGMENRISQ